MAGSSAAGRNLTELLAGAAVLLVAVGETLAKEILRALPEADVQRLTEELADLLSDFETSLSFEALANAA